MSVANIPPGNYKIALRVEDVSGNVQGSASEGTVTITDGTLPSPPPPTPSLLVSCSFSPNSAFPGDKVTITAISISGQIDMHAGTASSVLYHVGFLSSPGSMEITIPSSTPAGGAWFEVGGHGCFKTFDSSAILTIKSLTLDTDQDGFPDYLESRIGTDPTKSCGINAWPPDFNNDGKVDSTDQALQVQHTATYVGAPNYDKRYDLNFDGKINSIDQLIEAKQVGKTCTL